MNDLVYFLLNIKILKSKLKATVDDGYSSSNDGTFCERVENIFGKEGNAGYQHFLFFTSIFSMTLIFRVKTGDCVVKDLSDSLFPEIPKSYQKHNYTCICIVYTCL